MAKRKETRVLAPFFARLEFSLPSVLKLFLPVVLLFVFLYPAFGQTSQQYVYLSVPGSPSSSLSGLSNVSQTGALSLVPNSPFNERFEGGLLAIDGQGKFLFVLNALSNDISMFQIDQTSGALNEVPGSPFAVPPTINPNMAPSQPISIAAEASGKFLFVGYLSGDFQGESSVVSLAVDTSGSSPVLVTVQSTLTNSLGAPAQLLTDPKGLHLYVGLSKGQNGIDVGGAEVYRIDSVTGKLAYQGMADVLNSDGMSYAIDSRDRFLFAGGRGNAGSIESCVISPVDGTANSCSPVLSLGFQELPAVMLAENSGQFLYVYQSLTAAVFVYSIDQATGALTQVLGPLSSITFVPGNSISDPMGPYIYSAAGGNPPRVHGYLVDQQSGNLTEIAGSPFSSGLSSASSTGGLAISGNPAQAITGPAVSIFPATANFSSVVGTPSATQVFSIVNVGGQLLAINSISIAGTNASSFSQTNTCLATLAPNASCSVSITFTSPSVGTFTASLQVSDNAPGTPQTLALNGLGLAPQPAVTFSPTAPSFPATNQGTSSPSQTLSIMSTGTAPLHVSSVSLAGSNPSDFSFTNNCNAPVAPGSSCTISLVFGPTAPGQRLANLMIADDAPGSPQTVVLSGTGIAVVPALTFSPGSPSFPATTQGTSSAAQTLTASNSGNAPLQISSIALSGPNGSEFSFTNNCTASLAPAASCTISLVFSPLASGQRAASLVVSDNGAGSPQTVSLSAAANPAFSVGAAPGSSLLASVSAGQTAQYQLQMTPGQGFSGAVSLACSGAPLNATCQVPSTVSLANGTAATFSVTVKTSGSAIFPPSVPFRMPPVSGTPVLPLLALAVLLLLVLRNYRTFVRANGRKPLALCGVLASVLFCAFLGLAGCGGGSAALAPPPIVTPPGTSTITITLAAISSSGQPLQLQPIQLTLTVN